MAWRAASSVPVFHNQLKTQVPSAAPPHTDVNSWGTVCDLQHATSSDHCPHDFSGWGNDIVTAGDWPHAPALGLDAGHVSENLRVSRDNRIKYVIFNRRMFSSYAVSGYAAWAWRPYGGSDPHTDHGHLSVVADPRADNTSPWQTGYGAINMALDPQESQWLQWVNAYLDGIANMRPTTLGPGTAREPLELVTNIQGLASSVVALGQKQNEIDLALGEVKQLLIGLQTPTPGGQPFTQAQLDQIRAQIELAEDS